MSAICFRLPLIGAGALLLLQPHASVGQTTGRADDLQAYLAAPLNGPAFYRSSEQARTAIEQERWADAEHILIPLVREYPLLGTNWGRLGLALQQQGKHLQAVEAYERVLAIQGPGLPFNARYRIGVCLTALGETERALDVLQRLVFEDAYLFRARLAADRNFASLRDHPRFREIASPAAEPTEDRVIGWRRDISYLTEELRRTNPNGAVIPQEFIDRGARLSAAVSTLSDDRIVAELGRMMGSLDRGHTNLFLGTGGGRLSITPIPLRLWIFPEGVFVTHGYKGQEALAGAQVLRFGRTDAAEALRLVSSAQSSESPQENLWLSPDLLTLPALLSGLGIGDSNRSIELTLRMRDGRTVRRRFEAGEARPRPKLNPPLAVSAPLFLRNTAEVHWTEHLPKHHSLYVQVNNMAPDRDETLPQFGVRLRREIDRLRPRNLIIDLRHNNGGNSFTYVELLRTLTAFSAVPGHRVYALIGRNVYSAAGNFSTDMERLVQPIFVGEPTSQTGNQWGDESFLTLPYSGLQAAFAGLRWQTSHPWDKRRSIVPHVPVQLTAADYFAGHDPVLAAVIQLIEDGRRAQPADK